MKRKTMAIVICFSCFALLLFFCNPYESNISNNSTYSQPLRILIDIDYGSRIKSPKVEEAIKTYKVVDDKRYSLNGWIKEIGGPHEIEFDFLPTNGTEREIALTKLRTELMAGKGPDVFVCLSEPSFVVDNYTTTVNGMLNGSWEYPVFNYPQQAIARNMFLNLEPYKKNFHYTHWDKLTSVILEAGKYRGEQYVVPMSYTLPITLFKKQNIQHIHSIDMTWDNMIDETIELRIAAVANSSVHSGNAFFPLVKENEDELTFSEEELFDFIKKKRSVDEKLSMMDNLPLYYTCLLGVGYDIDESFFSLDEQLYSMIPIYSTRGGYGANITCFTAINANTEHIEDAVFMLDYFLSEEFQRSELFSHITLGNSVPILEGLMQENTSCVGHDNEQWFMLSENYKEFCNLRDKIAYAEFSTPLELDIRQLYSDSKTCNDDETLRSMVHKTYIQMNMKLAES